MPRPLPPAESLALTTLRRARGLTEGELAELSGLSKGLVSRYELGTDRLPREKLDEFADAMDYDTADVDSILHGILGATTRPDPGPLSPVDPTPAERRRIREVLGRLAQAELEDMEQRFIQQLRETRAQRDRNAAEDLVRWLLEEPDAKARRELVEGSQHITSGRSPNVSATRANGPPPGAPPRPWSWRGSPCARPSSPPETPSGASGCKAMPGCSSRMRGG